MQSKELQVALDAAKKAENIIMDYYRDGVAVETKSDNSPVTLADKEAEQVIIETIKTEFPDHGFIGEESGTTDGDVTAAWIIDPIDGTKNFTAHIPYFGTQIALSQEGKVTVGVSSMPAIAELLYADTRGAFLNDAPIATSDTTEVKDARVLHGRIKYFIEKNYIDGLHNISLNCYQDRGFGDCFMYHLLAAGKVDAAIEAKIDFWDIAAAVAIVERAGGVVTDLDGNPVGVKSTSMLAAATPELHASLLSYFA